jgi:hypothetical protein
VSVVVSRRDGDRRERASAALPQSPVPFVPFVPFVVNVVTSEH